MAIIDEMARWGLRPAIPEALRLCVYSNPHVRRVRELSRGYIGVDCSDPVRIGARTDPMRRHGRPENPWCRNWAAVNPAHAVFTEQHRL